MATQLNRVATTPPTILALTLDPSSGPVIIHQKTSESTTNAAAPTVPNLATSRHSRETIPVRRPQRSDSMGVDSSVRDGGVHAGRTRAGLGNTVAAPPARDLLGSGIGRPSVTEFSAGPTTLCG